MTLVAAVHGVLLDLSLGLCRPVGFYAWVVARSTASRVLPKALSYSLLSGNKVSAEGKSLNQGEEA